MLKIRILSHVMFVLTLFIIIIFVFLKFSDPIKKTSLDGTELAHFFDNENFNTFTCTQKEVSRLISLEKTQGGYLQLLGKYEVTKGNGTCYLRLKESVITKYNDYLSVIWEHQNEGRTYEQVIELSDNRYVALSYIGNYIEIFSKDHDLIVTKEFADSVEMLDITKVDKTNFLVLQRTKEGKDSKYSLSKYTNKGDTVFTKELENSRLYEKVVHNDDLTYVIANKNNMGILEAYDNKGEKKWVKEYKTFSNILDIKKATDDSLYLAGYHSDYLKLEQIGKDLIKTIDYRSVLMKIDLNGKTIWEETYNRYGMDVESYDLINPLDNGDVIVFDRSTNGLVIIKYRYNGKKEWETALNNTEGIGVYSSNNSLLFALNHKDDNYNSNYPVLQTIDESDIKIYDLDEFNEKIVPFRNVVVKVRNIFDLHYQLGFPIWFMYIYFGQIITFIGIRVYLYKLDRKMNR